MTRLYFVDNNEYCNGGQLIGAGVIMPQHELLLQMAHEAYVYPEKRKRNMGDFIYNPTLSTLRTAIYSNGQSIIMANRGTKLGDSKDLASDAAILTGAFRLSNRYKKARATRLELAAAYPSLTITQVGHSLGGRVASELGREFGDKVVTFNMGENPAEIVSNVKEQVNCALSSSDECRNLRLQTHYTTGYDPISVATNFRIGAKTVASKNLFNPHSLSAFK